jgi:iron complex outermembrane receptor protein
MSKHTSALFVVSLILPAAALVAQQKSPEKTTEPILVLEKFVTDSKGNDPINLLSNEPTDSVFGFKKSLLETPRALTVLSDELMSAYGIESALDVTKLVPSTFTTSIFGINGNVNIRGVPSDTYFRGMKRLENTQLFPSPITAMSRLEVLRGPPSPIYGPGKVGGYTNFVPKSARADTGKYLDSPTGKITLTYGSYDRKSGTFEVGGPLSLFNRKGGYYVYVDAQKSDTYYDNVNFDQYVVQSSFNFELTPKLRVEFGEMYQYWGGKQMSGWNRVTQELIDKGIYNSGLPLVNMDKNGDGLISTAEVDSYTSGSVNGALLRTIAAGTPTATVKNSLAATWLVDPATMGKVQISRHATTINPEDGGQANITLGYFDTIFEASPDTTISNKVYSEFMHRYKWERSSAFAQNTASFVFEDKLVYEKSFDPKWDWLKFNMSAAANWRYYDTQNHSGTKYSDLVNRGDLSRPFSQLNRFAVSLLEPALAPWNSGLTSTYTNAGFGALFDITVKEKTNIVLGTRADWVSIYSHVPLDVITTPGLKAENSVDGRSWSASISHEVFKGIRPYFTYARQKTLIIGIDGGIGIPAVPTALNGAELRELGIKSSLLDNKLFTTLTGYRQTRTSFSIDTGQVLSTLAKGVEAEVRWVPNKHFSLSAGGTWQKTIYTPIRPATISVPATFFGLPDGDYYGGRLQSTLGAEERYIERPGYPDKVLTATASYFFSSGWNVNLSGAYQASVPAGRLQDVILPSALTFDTAVAYETRRWGFRLGISNLTNELYFTPNAPDGTGELIVIPAPERAFKGTVTYKF